MNRAPPIEFSLEGEEIDRGLISTAEMGEIPSQLERKGGSSTIISISFPHFAQGAIIVTASAFMAHSRRPLELEDTEPELEDTEPGA